MDSAEAIIQKIVQDYQLDFSHRSLHSCYHTEEDIITEFSLDDVHFEDFEPLSPLFKTVKKLDIWLGCTFKEDRLAENIRRFEKLEELSISATTSQAANDLLALDHLKKLSLWIKVDPATQPAQRFVLNCKEIPHLQSLSLSCKTITETDDFTFIIEELGQLRQLTELDLECNCQIEIQELSELPQLSKLTLYDIDIQTIPKLISLKTLSFSHRLQYTFDCVGKFPNLENLHIDGFSTVHLGAMPNLKILVMGARDFDFENSTCFDHLPNLEELRLTWCDMVELQKIGQLKNLKLLDLSENEELTYIDELAKLTALEKLNLFSNNISDIRVLNQLPNLKLVDLAANPISPAEAAAQLDRPEIACFMGLPHVPFYIGGSEIF